MSHADFVHLRVHSAYSLSEGAIPVKQLVSLCSEMNMPAVAVTDTNNLFGALEFSSTAAASGVQPIIGCLMAINVADNTVIDEQPSGPSVAINNQHLKLQSLVLLVQNEAGYLNLLKCLSNAYLDQEDVSDPHIDLEFLESHSDGLIVLSGGPIGPIGQLLLNSQFDAAGKLTERLKAAFPGRFYMEIMRHGMEQDKTTENHFLDLAYNRDIPIVATNDVFFSTPDMYEAHDALLCIAAGAFVSQDDRPRLTTNHYLKTATEMRKLFHDLPEAIDNTIIIAKRCAYRVNSISPLLPPYDCGEGRSEEDELRDLTKAGLKIRLENHVITETMSAEEKATTEEHYYKRMEFELETINQMGFPGYFLIVADFIHWTKEQGIPVGPGRGSGAGSVVAWALTITDLDPLRFGLLFERFLNPERVSMPDFDIDFCQDRRDEVITYVQKKYGRDRVAQIITFGKLQARAVLRDVGRVLEIPYGYVDKICKLVPNNPASPMTLPEAIAAEPQIATLIREDSVIKHLMELAKKLEGLYRHASTHAAGVVIGDRPLDKLIPLYRDPRSDMPVSGFNMKFVESAGLVKFDFLGLKTLTVLTTAVNLCRDKGIEIDLLALPFDDPATFKMIERGETTGVFQLESAGMRDVLKKMKPDTFEDIIAVVALYRPGPMDNIPSYIRRKHGEEEADYLYPTLEGILKETFGIMIYQEQVMQIAQELSGYSLGGADLLRRAMGKKIKEEMDQQRQIFVNGAKNKGVPEKKANLIFDQVNKFAGYGFNKSHAAAYALVAYQTAYMKANHPVEFLAASMTLDLTNTDKLNVFKQELDRLKIKLLPPDLNKSKVVFSVEDVDNTSAIRYALAAVKNVGQGAMEGIVKERSDNGPFKDFNDLINRIDPRNVNKRQLENLARAGAFNFVSTNRRRVYQGVEALLRHANLAASERNSNQMGLFGGDKAPTPDITLPEVPDWMPLDRLREEFDAIGFYLSAHPLDAFSKRLEKMKVETFSDVTALGQARPVNLAGTLIGKKERISQKGSRYAFLQFSDASGSFEITAFSETLSEAGDLLDVGNSLLIKATAQNDQQGDGLKFLAQSFRSLEKATADDDTGLSIKINSDEALKPIKEILDHIGKGRGQVIINAHIKDKGWIVAVELPIKYKVMPEIVLAIKALPGVLEIFEN